MAFAAFVGAGIGAVVEISRGDAYGAMLLGSASVWALRVGWRRA